MTSIKILAFPAFKNKNSNPYNYLLYSGIETHDVEVREFSFISCLRLNYDVIHIHWPELYLNSHYFLKALINSSVLLLCLGFAKICGKKIIWTVHNLQPHQIRYRRLNRIFWSLYLHLVDGIISLSRCNEELFFKQFQWLKKLPSIAIHHGLYKGFYSDSISQAQARQQLSIGPEQQVCLFIGQIKTYKNIDRLIELFNNTAQLMNKVLIIAGKFESDSYFNKIRAQAQGNPNIIIHNSYIPGDELQLYFRAADLCILPFKNIFNSGSVLLSISFDTPVLVPDSSNFNEYAEMLDEGLIYTFKGQLSSDDILHCYEVITPEASPVSVPEIMSWDNLQGKMTGFYKHIINE